MSNDFFCRYGEHWTSKEFKIATARQGNYICADCEDKRLKHHVQNYARNRRRDDDRTEDQSLP